MRLTNGNCIHVALFGTYNENRYFLGDYKNSFDLIGLNANIVAHAPGGMAAFISKLKNKSYFIDPQTHAFQQKIRTIQRKEYVGDDKNNIEWVLKESIKKLSGYFGPLIENIAGKDRLKAGGLDSHIIEELCENVINFQETIIRKSCRELNEWEFVEHSGKDITPNFLIAPYFYLEPENIDNELVDNIEFIKKSKFNIISNDINKPLFAEIIISKNFFEKLELQTYLSTIVSEYNNSDADGFVLWIDDFSEIEDSQEVLKSYINFVTNLCKSNKPILVLHGSYLSIALSGNGFCTLAGVGHGMEYGESRSVVPVGGGVPLAKYYFPKFFKRVNYDPDATKILLEMNWTKDKITFHRNVCNCDVCNEVIESEVQSGFSKFGETSESFKNNKLYPTSQAMDLSRRHYLNTKSNEYKFCKTASKQELIEHLKTNYNLAKKIPSYSFEHLDRWINLLEKI